MNAGGLNLSFSLEKVTFINGTLVATTHLTIPSLNSLGNAQTLADNITQQAIVASLQNAAGSSYNPITAAWTINGGGSDIYNTTDQFRFVSQSANGNCEIKARVTFQENTDPWAKAGVMIRETSAANSIHAMLVVAPGNGFSFQRRTSTGGASSFTAGGALNAAPNNWVRVVRSGNTITASKSSDGATWTQVGSMSISMANSVQIGLSVTAHNNAALSTVVFDRVTAVP